MTTVPQNEELFEGYERLHDILMEAFLQSAAGKGRQRHANELPWEQQPIIQITRSKGVGFPAGQADKKITEALGMHRRGEICRAVHELRGAIVYLAALIHVIEVGDVPYAQNGRSDKSEPSDGSDNAV